MHRDEIHPTITRERLLNLIRLNARINVEIGVCLGCSTLSSDVKPDSRDLRCWACHEPKVYAAETALARVA